jgi:hypothetical protein
LLVNKDSEIKEYADKVKVEMTLVCECSNLGTRRDVPGLTTGRRHLFSLDSADTVLGVEFDWPGMTFPAMPNDKTRMEEWCSKYLPELFQSGTIKPNPIQSFSGGLDNITEGLNYIKEGKVTKHRVLFAVPTARGRSAADHPYPERDQNRGVKVTYKI